MDIPICLDRLGVKPDQLRLSQSVPPHTIVEWIGGDPQPTEAELQAAWDAYQAEGGFEMENLRQRRDQLLTETDWVTLKAIDDSNDGLGIQLPQVWMDYRQALRDLPANTVDPANPVWPTKPGGN